jgi:hypothetical protein
MSVLGITRRKFFQIKKEFLTNHRWSGIHANTGGCNLSWNSEAVVNYLTKYFEQMCDNLPTGNIMHLHSNIRKHEIFEQVKKNCLKGQGQQCCSYTTFSALWKKHFPNVKIPKVMLFQTDLCFQAQTSWVCNILLQVIFKLIFALYQCQS